MWLYILFNNINGLALAKRQIPEDLMQFSVTTTEGLERQMKVAVPAEQVDNEVLHRLKKIGKTARIKGFRKGKAPIKVLQRDYGIAVRDEVVGDVIQSSYVEALTQESIRPAGSPRIDDRSAEPGQELTYTAIFEVYPTPEAIHYEGFELEETKCEIGDVEVDDVITRMREQRKNFEKVDRAAENGDRVMIDFIGTIDGEKFMGGEAEDYPLQLGVGTMLPGFEEPIIGAKAGEQRDVTITFPDEYNDETLAGKEAVFVVTLKQVEGGAIPELDSNFVERMGIEDGSVETLRKEVKDNMQRELDVAVRGQVKTQVFDTLAKANQFEVPKSMVEAEIEGIMKRARENAARQGKSPNVERENLREEAVRRVRLGVVLNEIVLKNKLKVSQKELREFIVAETASYEKPEEAVKMMLSDKDRMEGIEPLVLENKVIDLIVEKSTVKTKTASFDDIMGRSS
ncbi:MAG: trigger factor [Gammaproteobacteria bacterium]|nr:trigger factor [Gammaproteobacteria bacterium]